jgi:hypothetical protein
MIYDAVLTYAYPRRLKQNKLPSKVRYCVHCFIFSLLTVLHTDAERAKFIVEKVQFP